MTMILIEKNAAEKMLKAHVKGYTRKDGTFVKEHDDSRTAAAHRVHHSELKEGDTLYDADGNSADEVSHMTRGLKASDRVVHTRAGYALSTKDGYLDGYSNKKPGASKPKKPASDYQAPAEGDVGHEEHANYGVYHRRGDQVKDNYGKKHIVMHHYDHPNVVGHAEKLEGGGAHEAYAMHFAGKQYFASGKEGNSFHDNTPVRHFKEMTDDGEDSGEHVWMDHSGRVHADATSDVPRLRKDYEAHVAKSGKSKKTVKPTKSSGSSSD